MKAFSEEDSGIIQSANIIAIRGLGFAATAPRAHRVELARTYAENGWWTG